MADSGALREVVVNLVQNAIAHTARKTGIITISATKKADEIETTVADNGSGIPADAIPHLFTKFYRVNEMNSATRGTGLGLYICKSIIEAHGGAIWVESEEGKGTTFSFRIPVKPVANLDTDVDNSTSSITRGAHGWIKDHSVH